MSDFSLPLYPLEPQMPDAFSMWKEAYSRPPQSIDHKKVTALSRVFKEDPKNVQGNLDDYQARFAARQLYSSSFKREFPTLSSNLNNAQFISRVRDDMGNLIETEGWWNGVANAYAVSRDTVAIGYIGTRAMLDGRDLYPYERRKIERARKLQRAHTESQPGWVAAGAELLGTMQETLMYSLGAAKTAAMVSGPLAPYTAPIAGFTAAFASSFNLEAGNLYADLIMDGYTPAEAANIGYQYGALIAGFESLGMKGAGAGLRGLGRELMKGKGSSLFARKTAGKAFTDIILRDYLAKGVGGESLTEGIQEIIGEFAKTRASELYRPDNLYEPEYWDTFWHTVGHTAKGMIVLGGIPAGTRLAMDTIRSAQSQHDGKKAREAVELRRNSKAPEAQEKVDAEAGETLESTYYVRAQDMMGSIRQAEKVDKDTEGRLRKLLNSKHKGIVEKLEEAERHDGEVKLSKNEWETVFAQGLESNFTKVAFRNVAFEEGGFTNAEADAHEAAREKLMEEANEETKKALQDMDTFEEELREVRLEMREMLKGVVKGTSSELTLTAAHQATLLVGFIRRNALLMNIGPREYVEKHLPKIIQQNLDAKQAAQTQQQAEDRSNVLNAFAGTASNMTGEVKQRLQEAAKLAKQGKDAREIWKKTGWYIGPDGNPYYEINDQNVEVSPEFVQSSVGTSHSLKEVLNHPELFEAYPELGGIEIRYVTGQKNKDGGAEGSLAGLVLDDKGVARIQLNENLRKDPRLLKSVLMHEVQHAIQVQEQSRVQGGSVNYAGRTDIDGLLDRDYASLESSLSEAARAVEKDGKSIIQMFRDLYQGIVYHTNSPSDQKEIRSSIQELADGLSESDKQHILESLDIMDGFYQTGDPDSKYKTHHYMVYQRLAGEVEARNMEARLSMTAEERRQSYPDDTADVPASRVILAVGPGTTDGSKVLSLSPIPGVGFESFPGQTFSRTPQQRAVRDIEARPVFENTDASNFDQDANYTFTEADYRPEVVGWARDLFGDRVAPNGKLASENFTRWFGDSKVVDAEGKPLVVYHGTSVDNFDNLDPTQSEYGLFGFGTYFTEDKSVSIDYSENRRKGGTPRIFETFLNIKNPIDMDASINPEWALSAEAKEYGLDFEGLKTNEQAYRELEDALISEGMEKYEGSEAMQNALRGMGFDGITHVGGGRKKSSSKQHQVYIAFDPNQIKSTNNEGNFSADENILNSQEDVAETKAANFGQDSDYTFVEADYRPEVVGWARDLFGDRMAPNGKPVYQNFTRWFGDSKAVDAEGKPLVVYHGTNKDFVAFDKIGGRPIWVAVDPEVANQFVGGGRRSIGDKPRKGSRVLPLHVKVENPMHIPGTVHDDMSLVQLLEIAQIDTSPANMRKMAQRSLDTGRAGVSPTIDDPAGYLANLATEKRPLAQLLDNPTTIEALQAAGFDGVQTAEREGQATFVVFDSNQIKSTNNEGNFSADENILESSEEASPQPKIVRAYHGTAGRFEDFNKAVRDALAKWDVVKEKLQADIDKAQAEFRKTSREKAATSQKVYDKLESDEAQVEKERKEFREKHKDLFVWDKNVDRSQAGLTSEEYYAEERKFHTRRNALRDQATRDFRNDPQIKATRDALAKVDEAKNAYAKAKSEMAPSVNEDMLSDFFSERFIGSTDYGYGPRGIYFTEDIGQAESYSSPTFSGRDKVPGYKPEPYVYTVDIDTSQFYDSKNPVPEVEKDIQQQTKVETSLVRNRRGGPEAYEAAYAQAKRTALEKAGYKGMIFSMPRMAGSPGFSATGEEIVVFDTSVIQEVSSKDGTLYSKQGDQKKTLGQAVFTDDVIKKILLDPDAKPTTLMHELTHWNLEMMATMGLDIESKIAQEGYEPSLMEAEMLGDIQRLIKWSGYKGTLKEWSAMSVEERRPFHEAVAVSFEIYLVEGKAPSRELRGVFERLLAYIGDTYKALVETFQQDYAREFGERREALGIDPQLPGLNPDVRAIFGRMLSASRDVDSFLDENELKTMMISKEDFVILRGGKNLDEEDRKALEAQWNEYHQEFLDAITRAKAELTIHRINEVKYQQRAYERIGKEIKREIKSATDIIRQQEEKALSLTSVYQYRSWIRTGKYQTEEGERTLPLKDAEGNDIKNPKLDAEEVEAADPQNAKSLKKRKLTKKGGVPLEIVRKAFGFKDVKEMLQALAQSKTLKGEVNVRTDQRVREELTDLTDPVLMQERMQKAVHNNIRRRMVALELKYLLNNGRASKVETALAKKAAKEIIESTATGNIDISAYSRAAARARKKALKALKDGDMEAAAFAKRQELLNESLVSEGLKAREEIRRLMKHNEKVFKPKSDKALGKAKHDVIVVKALRALLSHFGIGRVEGDAKEMLARLVKHDPTFYNQEAEQIRSLLSLPIAQPRVGDRRKPVEHLTLKQIRTLRMLSERFMHRSKQNIKSKIEGKKQTVKENQELATKALEDNVPVSKIDPDGRKSIFGRIRDWFSDLIRFEHLFRRADGGKESGIWTKMFRMVKDSGNAYRAEVRDFTLWFSESLKALDLKVPGGERALTFKVLDNEVVIGEGGLNVKSKLIHMAMHFYSNSSNRERLVRGYVGKHEDSEVDAQRMEQAEGEIMEQAEGEIRSFFNQQIQQGLLTKADFDFMQSVFSKLSGSDMLGRAQKVMMSHSNYEMDTIEGEEFSIPFPDGTSSTYAGGYIPVRYDRSGAKRGDVDQFEEDMSIDGQSHRMLSILPSFTKERTAPDPDPLDLNLSSIQHHAAEVYRFIHMTEPVTEVYKVINGEGVRKAFVQRFGAKAYNNMDGWLRRSAHQRFDKGDDTEVGKMMLALSRNANMAVMFLNIGNSLQNYAGLVIPMRRVGARGIISALISSSFSSAARKEIAAKSKEMAGRLDRQIFDIYTTQQKLLTSEDGMWANVKGWTNRWAYVMQQYTQNHVDVAVWQAAYNQETAKALDGQASAEEAEARAVAYADSVVRGSQMAGEKEDLSHFESGGTALKAMFPFKSWFINWMNNAANQGRLDMSDADQGRMLALAQTYMYLLMLPSLLATAATKVAAGAEWGDDDEDFSDDMFEFWFRSQLDQVTGGLPVISDLKRMIEGNWLDDKHWNNRYPTTPWQRGLEKLVQGSAKGFDFDSTMGLSAQFADLAGLPISRAWNSASMIGDELAGDLRSEGTMDLIRGMATGKRSASQRL